MAVGFLMTEPMSQGKKIPVEFLNFGLVKKLWGYRSKKSIFSLKSIHFLNQVIFQKFNFQIKSYYCAIRTSRINALKVFKHMPI